MKALQITSYIDPEGFMYQEASVPRPARGQVTIDVEYARANYVEALFVEGLASRPLLWTPGVEATGRIRELGEGVEGLTAGEPVAAPITILGTGGYGQVALAKAPLTVPLPPGVDPTLASVVPSNTTTALATLERIARIQPGEHVLMQAAAGGLGTQFGQIARLFGAGRIVGVVGSERKRQVVLDLGYDEVRFRDTLPSKDSGQFDVIVDPVFGPAWPESLRLLRSEGRLLAFGDVAQAGDQRISTNTLWSKGVNVLGFNIGGLGDAHPDVVGSYLRRVLMLVTIGQVTVPVQERLPISDAARALTTLRSGGTIEKFILMHERD